MSADTIKELHIQRDKWIEAAIKQQSRAKRAEASLASSQEEIEGLRKALAEADMAKPLYSRRQLEAELDRVKLHLSAWEDSARINKARADEAEAELALARKALEPFGRYPEFVDANLWGDDARVSIMNGHTILAKVTVGDLRAARALSPSEEQADPPHPQHEGME